MFDISFTELMMVGIVGLLVIGPEKLPKVARTLGAYTGRLQRYVTQVKEEVNREVRFEELQALQEEIQEGANQVKSSILEGGKNVQDAVAGIEEDVKPKRKTAVSKASQKKAIVKNPPTKKPAAKKAPVKNTARKKVAAKKPAVRKVTTRKAGVKQARNQAER